MFAALLVADSGPLIALARLDLLQLLARLFDASFVTETVWNEVTRAPREDEGPRLVAARQAGWLQVTQDIPASLPLPDLRLDAGERSAIALALAQQAVLLIDERRGRKTADRLGLPVLGTLGLLVLARQTGLVQQVRPLALALEAGGYFLSRTLVEHTLARIGE